MQNLHRAVTDPANREYLMDNITLASGVKMPILDFGTFKMKDVTICENAVQNALACGYRLIDTAASYENEAFIGKAIQHSGIPRDELFITTKLWIQDYGYEKTKDAFYRSMDR